MTRFYHNLTAFRRRHWYPRRPPNSWNWSKRGLEPNTVAEFYAVLWSFLEFLGRDAPIGELTQDIPEKFLAWLRHTPIAPRKRKRENRPTSFDAGSVTAFFHWIGWKADERGLRSETTVRKYWRYIAPFSSCSIRTTARKG